MMNHGTAQKLTKGFTLLELVIVLGILTIVSTGVFVSIRSDERNSEQRNLQNASLALQADIRYAQRRSITEGRRHGVEFRIIDNFYSIVLDTPRETIRVIHLQNNVRLLNTGGVTSIMFYPRGTTSRSFTILLQTARYEQSLTIIPSSGRVEISEIRRT